MIRVPKCVMSRLVCNDSLHSDNHVSNLFILCLVCQKNLQKRLIVTGLVSSYATVNLNYLLNGDTGKIDFYFDQSAYSEINW